MPWKRSEPMEQRMEFAVKALRTQNFRRLCREYGISAKTGYKWMERLLRDGLAGMREESRRPRHHPEALGEEVVCEMVRLKQAHRHWGPRKIRDLYERKYGTSPSESSFKRVLERAGLTEPRRLRRAREGGRLQQGKRAQACNEVWTVDFKGWWNDRRGERCEPLTVRDEFSRYVLELRRLPDSRTETVRARFERLFENHGLPGAIRSDNGVPFAASRSVWGISRLSAWWLALGIDLERGRPAHPQDNGGHERMHRDISREIEPVKGDQDAMDVWREEFNHERPHEALDMKRPAEVYQKSARKYQGTPQDLEYEGMATRRVNGVGLISWKNEGIAISSSLRGWSVGIQAAQQSLYEVRFSRLLLGWIDERTDSFLRADIRPQEAGQTKEKV